jgi:hypothetical protein
MKLVRVYQELESLPDSYLHLFNIKNQGSRFFLSYPWFKNLIHHSLSSEHSMRFFGLESASGDKAYALAPMCFLTSQQTWFSPRKLIAASNYYTSLFQLLQDDADLNASDNFNVLIRAMIDDTPRWDCIDMHPMAFDSTQFATLQKAFGRVGALAQSYFCFGNWYLKLEGRSFQEYFNTVPSRIRNTIERKSRQLEKNQGLNIQLIQTEDELRQVGDAYARVYQSSWKQSEAHPHFIASLMEVAAQQGWLRLGIAYIGDKPVAAQLWFVYGDVAHIYKLAYDEQFAKFSIGSILTAHMMRHVIDIDRVTEVDYLTGDDEYKKDWMSHRRERWGVIAFNQATLKGRIFGFWHLGRQMLKSMFLNAQCFLKKWLKF